MRLQRMVSLATGIACTVAFVARAPAVRGQDQVQATANPHGALNIGCSECHRADAWKPATISKTFHHAESVFPLDGAHVRTACMACHQSLDFSKAPAACSSCHRDAHNGELGTQCARCHTARTFTDMGRMRTAHEATRFPLRGAHAAVDCISCHASAQAGHMQFTGRPTTCISCHADVYRTATTPDHVAAHMSQDCASCHSVGSWTGARFDHSVTRFPLDGAHRAVSCNGCHADRVYAGKPTECSACHMTAYNQASPPHAAAGFPTTCTTCHNTTSWTNAPFDHAATQFPLTGAHATVACASCHSDGVYHGKPTTCISCHQANYNTALLPPHQALAFSTACTTCHNNVAWQPATFDHSTTQFPLTGAHRAASCQACHADKVYQGKPTTCVSCHQADYNTTNAPAHAAAGYPTTCENCHATASWTASFDHSTTQFPLTGAHATVACTSCHGDGVYKGKPTACISCHQTNYNTALLPPHSSLGFTTACSTCHTTVGWQPATFDHSTTLFPLTGAHLAASCADCHADKVYQGKPTTCVSCHQSSYAATTNPVHTAAGFGTTCESCHTTATWAGAVFNHANTKFPLTGAHASVPCASCHGDGVYAAKTTLCSGCHMTDYNTTNNPAHGAAGFPTTCDQCHTTTTWLGATFNHDASFFPIYSGAHQGRWSVCADCHTSATNFAVFTCITCHTKSATDPHHQGVSGYVFDSPHCYSCHPRGRAG